MNLLTKFIKYCDQSSTINSAQFIKNFIAALESIFIQTKFNYSMIDTLFKNKIFNLDNITKDDNNKDWPYRKFIIGPSGSGKTNYLLNSIPNNNNIIDRIYA